MKLARTSSFARFRLVAMVKSSAGNGWEQKLCSTARRDLLNGSFLLTLRTGAGALAAELCCGYL